MTDDERLRTLERKLADLQRHVLEQDKVMLELSTTIERTRREIGLLRQMHAEGRQPEPDGEPADERPPHY
jgi:SlyX protein